METYRCVYPYKWYVNGVPARRQYLAEVLERIYKRTHEEKDESYFQQRITEPYSNTEED